MALASAAHEVLGALASPLAGLRAVVDGAVADPHSREQLERTTLHRLEELMVVAETILCPAVDLEVEAVDLVALVEDVIAEGQWSRTHVLTADLPEGCAVRANPSLVKRVLANLLSNAARHTAPGRQITVAAEPAGQWMTISVSDEGAGVHDTDHAVLFRPGFRGQDAVGDGFGLGLHVVRHIVRAHGGSVWAEPSRNGARFCFTLQNLEPTTQEMR